MLIANAWRDEGTSLHYLAPSEWVHLDLALDDRLVGAFDDLDEPFLRGASWTTDAPFGESASAIDGSLSMPRDQSTEMHPR